MLIKKEQLVSDIQEKFSNQFPFLKIEFYSELHCSNSGSPSNQQYSESTLISTINPSLESVDIEITPEMTVSELEQLIGDKCKLNVQVFRKSAGLWLQTTSTDHWTLEKQNGKGERSTNQEEIEPIHVTDFDLE
jgi:hypothetical protein